MEILSKKLNTLVNAPPFDCMLIAIIPKIIDKTKKGAFSKIVFFENFKSFGIGPH